MQETRLKIKKILYLGLDPTRYPCNGELAPMSHKFSEKICEKCGLIHYPIIEIVPRPFSGPIEKAFLQLRLYSHILLTSRTAAQLYLDYCSHLQLLYPNSMKNWNLGIPHDKVYLSIGNATAEILERRGLSVQHIAKDQTAEGLIEMMESANFMDPLQTHIFFPRSSGGRALLSDYFRQRKIRLTMVDVYDTFSRSIPLPDLNAFDQIVFTSPSTVKAFFQIVSSIPPHIECCPIGPITEKMLQHRLSNC